MKLVFLGPPGSGKGTQAELVSLKLGVPHIDVGALLREEVDKKTDLGKKVGVLMKKGELLPHEDIDTFVEARLGDGFVLEGYPRELAEAEFLDSIAEIDAVIVLDVPDDVVIKRLLERKRADDKNAAIQKRLSVYREETEPLIEYYAPRKLVRRIDGVGSVEDVFKRIMKVI